MGVVGVDVDVDGPRRSRPQVRTTSSSPLHVVVVGVDVDVDDPPRSRPQGTTSSSSPLHVGVVGVDVDEDDPPRSRPQGTTMSSSPLHVVVVGLDVDADGPPEKPWSRDGASCSPTFWIGASKRLQWEHDPDKFGIRSSALSCRTCCWAAPSVAGSLTMAVREPDASGAGSVGGDEQR